jgi:ABC-type sugar transport system ATPase subunit
MNDIRFEHVYKSYGKVEIINDLNLEIPEGERLVLLGPSGCGKSTTLRMIAGFETITKGKLYMGDKIVNDVEPGDRNIAMVFQNYALYPHMTVAKNVCFGMEIAKIPKQEQKKRMDDALEMLGLTEYANRKPKDLSGGQRQRVALARAIVKKSPYFLLDEPLSNLDAKLRTYARSELVKIHEVCKSTFIYVTHDQIEAMTIGQKIALMNNHTLQQLDSPDIIYNRPKNVFVGTFIGSPSMNVFEAQISGNELVIGGIQKVQIPDLWLNITGTNKKIKVGIRPEHISLTAKGTGFGGTITYMENHGNRRCMTMQIPGLDNPVQIASDTDFYPESNKMFIDIAWDKMHFFDDESEENMGYPEFKKNEVPKW